MRKDAPRRHRVALARKSPDPLPNPRVFHNEAFQDGVVSRLAIQPFLLNVKQITPFHCQLAGWPGRAATPR